MPTGNLITIHHGHPHADSRVVAEGFGIQHESLIRALATHPEAGSDLKSEPRAYRTDSGQAAHYWLLTEESVMMLPAICKPSPELTAFQLRLVLAFKALRDAPPKAVPIPSQREAIAGWLAAVDERDALAAQVEAMVPDAKLGHALRHTDDTYTASQVARLLDVPRNRLIAAYEEHGWFWRDGANNLRAYAARVDAGHLKEKASTNESGSRAFITPRITGEGLDLTRKRLTEWGLGVAS